MSLHNTATQARQQVVFVFAGQGSQSPGMAAILFNSSPPFRNSLTASHKTCCDFGYFSLLKYLVEGEVPQDDAAVIGPQLALVAFELALVAYWDAQHISPSIVTGNSIGEYAALCTSGIMDEADALWLIHQRGLRLLEHCKAHQYKMLIVTGSNELAAHITNYIADFKTSFESDCSVALFNSPRKVIVAVANDQVQDLTHFLEDRALQVRTMHIAYAFHTAQMNPLLEPFRRITEKVRFRSAKIPFGSTLLGSFIAVGEHIPSDYLVRHAHEPAQFMQTLQNGVEGEILFPETSLWVEIGPSKTCLSFAKDTLGIEEHQCRYSVL